MATDQTEPPVKKILTIGSLAIVFLAGSEYFFQSYFNSMYGAEQQSQIYGTHSALLLRARASEDERLHQGPMPIDQAMSAVARGERPAGIVPRASSDYAAMHGWTLLPRPFEPAVVQPPVHLPMPPSGVQPPAPPTGPGMPPVGTGPTAGPTPGATPRPAAAPAPQPGPGLGGNVPANVPTSRPASGAPPASLNPTGHDVGNVPAPHGAAPAPAGGAP